MVAVSFFLRLFLFQLLELRRRQYIFLVSVLFGVHNLHTETVSCTSILREESKAPWSRHRWCLGYIGHNDYHWAMVAQSRHSLWCKNAPMRDLLICPCTAGCAVVHVNRSVSKAKPAIYVCACTLQTLPSGRMQVQVDHLTMTLHSNSVAQP